MSTFIDMAELVLSAPTRLQKTFLYKCSAADTSGDKYTKGWIIFLILIVYAGTTSFPFALSVQQGCQRKLLAHNMSRQRHQTLLVVGVMDFVPATHLWFKKKKKIHFHLMPWISTKKYSFLWHLSPLAKISLIFGMRNAKYPWSTAAVYHSTVTGLRKGICVLELNQLRGSSFLLERTTDGQTIVIHTWIFHGHFLEIEQSESVTIASDKIQVFKQKSEFWKICICQRLFWWAQ